MISLFEWRKRITIDPAIHHGDPCITGTRVPVSVIVSSIAEKDSVDLVLRNFPQISRENVQAALLYAAEAVSRFDVIPTTD